MDRVNVTEADTALHDLLDRVESGEEILLTRNGRDVARIVASAETIGDVVAHFRAIRADIAARGEPPFTWEELKQYRDEGRR